MGKFITGIHHVCIKCVTNEEFAKTKEFYGKTLDLELKRDWGSGVMFETGGGLIEVIVGAKENLPQGVVRHVALRTDDVDAVIAEVKKAGYEIITEPTDINIASVPVYPVRIAFCRGPMGEEIEFFTEK